MTALINSKLDLALVLETSFPKEAHGWFPDKNRRKKHRGSFELKIGPGITKDAAGI